MLPAKSICKKPGCNKLLTRPGYCPDHQLPPRDRFRDLDKKKSAEQIAFYRSTDWTETSRRHRVAEPLCRRCRLLGRIIAGSLVHHDPPLEELLKRGLNPYDDRYLETLCFNCHQKELHAKRAGNALQ